MAAIVGAFMSIFALLFFSLDQSPPAIVGGLMILWILGVIVIITYHGITYHVANAVPPGGVPTDIIQSKNTAPPAKTPAECVKDLEPLRDSEVIPDAEYARARQEVLQEA